jgi:hypothetical protein
VKISREPLSAKSLPPLAIIQFALVWTLKSFRYVLDSRIEIVDRLILFQIGTSITQKLNGGIKC